MSKDIPATDSFSFQDRLTSFVSRAATRYPIATHAIERFQRLGKPPSDGDIVHLTPRVETALEILAALAAHNKARPESTSALIRVHWRLVLGKWVEFFLRNVILSQKELTPEGLDAVEYSIALIPALLDSSEGPGDLDFAKHNPPHLPHLFAQVFFSLVDKSHHNWGPWANVLNALHSTTCDNPTLNLPKPALARVVYPEDKQLGLILIRHLSSQADRVPMMGARELEYLRSFMVLMDRRTPFQNQTNPMFLFSNTMYLLDAFIAVICPLLRKRSLRDVSTNSQEFLYANDIVLIIVFNIRAFMVERRMLEQVLDSKLIKAILHARTPFLKARGSTATKNMGIEGGFVEWSTKITDQIAKFLLYKSVTRKFSRVLRKCVDVEEALMRFQSESKGLGPKFVASWANVMDRAAVSNAHHQRVKGKVACSYYRCPLYDAPPEERAQVHYLRCLGCSSHAMYCSPICRKLDWKASHHFQCKWIAGKIKSGNWHFTDRYDLLSFEEWMKSYVRTHASVIMTKREQYMSSLKREARISSTTITDDQKAILEGRKQPALFLDFDRPHIPDPYDPNCVQFIDSVSVKTKVVPRYPWGREHAEKNMERWKDDPKVDENKLFLWGPFPNNRIRPWMVFDVVEFPPSLSGEGVARCEGFYRSLDHDVVELLMGGCD
ncbi:hypothetical protein V5O48_016035 [Marasmius crinis-equi]|uniref:MYND-type domain-containing protein n=1 Tax=Marasmius crinis-equi TaxID=585013 RepID=A0ABR3ET55_9AGAR